MYHAWISAEAVNYSRIPVIAAVLFFGMLVCIEIGYRRGRKQAAKAPDGYRAGSGDVTAALVTILGLLLGFTFGSAETRIDIRRQMIIEETNAIGTAYLRVDLLPAREQPVLRELFRKYLDVRLEAYASTPDVEKAMNKIAEASVLSGEIWQRTVRASRRTNLPAMDLLVFPALNNMIDIATTRTAVLLQHVPLLIILLLCGLSLLCSVLIGYRTSRGEKRNLLAAILFAAAVSASFYVIMDLEFPRSGLIRLDLDDRILFDLPKHLQEK